MMITNKQSHVQEAPLESFPIPKVQQELLDDDEEESLETLSLSDLPIYSNNSFDWEKYLANEYQSSSISSSSSSSLSSSSSSNQDYFEFFSEEWNSPNFSYPPDNIIFCGKLIPSKQPSSDFSRTPENQTIIRDKKRCLFRWKSDVSFYKSKKSSRKFSCGLFDGDHMKKNDKNKAKLSNSKSFPVQEKCSRRRKKEFSGKRRVSLSMFMSGLARAPSDLMELSDIRSRQSRRVPSTALFLPDGGTEKVAVCQRSEKGLWVLVRVLCCGGNHRANTVVKASFG